MKASVWCNSMMYLIYLTVMYYIELFDFYLQNNAFIMILTNLNIYENNKL